ncbi:MAG: GTPase Era [Gammaproteobacteria bacterium]|nr:GTPase Era [Gammaproteobacteria bacterium]
MNKQQFYGTIAIVGRPNVGKSTLLNRILQQKLSITSDKPQTTRQQILGIKTQDNNQVVYIDTPGIHKAGKNALNRTMNRAALSSLYDVNGVVFIVDVATWQEADQCVLELLITLTVPVILAVNKIDRVVKKDDLLPVLKALEEKMTFAEIIPLSAKTGKNVERLERVIQSLLPVASHAFDESELTNRSMRFLTAELIREKIMRLTGQELPYAAAVEIEFYQEQEKIIRISAIIWVERDSQKAIIIGKKGQRLKKIATQARLDMEKLVSNKVFLKLWVKVKDNWSDDARAVRSLGYDD